MPFEGSDEGGGGGSRREVVSVAVSGRTLPEYMRRRRLLEMLEGRCALICCFRETVVVVEGVGMARGRSETDAVNRMIK